MSNTNFGAEKLQHSMHHLYAHHCHCLKLPQHLQGQVNFCHLHHYSHQTTCFNAGVSHANHCLCSEFGNCNPQYHSPNPPCSLVQVNAFHKIRSTTTTSRQDYLFHSQYDSDLCKRQSVKNRIDSSQGMLFLHVILSLLSGSKCT